MTTDPAPEIMALLHEIKSDVTGIKDRLDSLDRRVDGVASDVRGVTELAETLHNKVDGLDAPRRSGPPVVPADAKGPSAPEMQLQLMEMRVRSLEGQVRSLDAQVWKLSGREFEPGGLSDRVSKLERASLKASLERLQPLPPKSD